MLYEDPQPPESGEFETCLLAHLFFVPARDILRQVAPRLKASDFYYPLWRKVYAGIIMECRKHPNHLPPDMLVVRDRIEAMGDHGYLGIVRGNMTRLVEVYGPMNDEEADMAIFMVIELAGKRRRYEAALSAAKLACDSVLSLDEIDANTIRLFRKARGAK